MSVDCRNFKFVSDRPFWLNIIWDWTLSRIIQMLCETSTLNPTIGSTFMMIQSYTVICINVHYYCAGSRKRADSYFPQEDRVGLVRLVSQGELPGRSSGEYTIASVTLVKWLTTVTIRLTDIEGFISTYLKKNVVTSFSVSAKSKTTIVRWV